MGIDAEIDLICATVSGVNLEKKEVKKAGDLFAEPIIIKKKTSSESLKSDKDDDSLVNRIKSSESRKTLLVMKACLDEAKDDDTILGCLTELESMTITFSQLQDVKIGISLNAFRKKTNNPELAVLAKKILRNWQKLVPVETKKEEVNKIIKSEIKTVKTGDEIRDHCKTALLKALKENKSIPESSTVNVKDLAEAVERAIFAMFKEVNAKYRSQVNSRVYNIKANVSLQENLLLGKIAPEEVAGMSHEEMACEDLKKVREELVKKGFQAVLNTHDPDDMFCTCRICLPPFLHA